MVENIFQLISKNSKKYKNKDAIIFQNERISYKSLNKNVLNLSRALYSLGVRRNDKIGLVLHNSVEFIYIMLAAAEIGAATVPLSTTLPINMIISNFQSTNVNFIICWHTILSKIILDKKLKNLYKKRRISIGSKVNGCVCFEDLKNKKKLKQEYKNNLSLINKDYIISLTSGSTGKPKPIVFSQKTKLLRALSAKKLYKLSNRDIVIASTPLEHSLSQRLIFLPLVMGSTLVLLKNFSEINWINQVQKYKVTFSVLVASQTESIFKKNIVDLKKIKSLKTLVSTSAKLSKSFKDKAHLFKKCNFYECYGTSEIAFGTSLHLNKDIKKTKSVGKACADVSLKIIDNNNRLIKKDNVIGEIACKTPLIFSGYLNKIKETKDSFSKNYFKTGDLGYLDKDKYLYLVGRKKNMVIVGGVNVYAEDVEEKIKNIKSVKDCCVIGVDDKRFGEAIVALVIMKKGKKKDVVMLKKYCFDNLADFQQPLAYKFVSKFPRNVLGKILRKNLKNEYFKKNLSNKISALMRS